MLKFRDTMDAHSIDVYRVNDFGVHTSERIAALQWHSPGPPKVVIIGIISSFSLEEMVQMVEELKCRSKQ